METIYRALNDAMNLLHFSLDENVSDQFKETAHKTICNLSAARDRLLEIDRAMGPAALNIPPRR